MSASKSTKSPERPANERVVSAQARLERQPKKVAIVGYTSTRSEAPFDDPEWEVWGMNNLHLHMDASKFDRWFDLHDRATIEKDEAHVAWLRDGAQGLPVFTWSPSEDWPTAVVFPKDPIVERYGRYFTNSVSWMTALAIDLITHDGTADGAELGIYGVDMAQGSEYAAQRPSCEYFLGIAAGLGIPVTIPETSDLLKCAALYGAEGDSALHRRLAARRQELQANMVEVDQQVAHLEGQLAELNGRRWALRGAYESNEYVLGVWTQPEAKRDDDAQGQ